MSGPGRGRRAASAVAAGRPSLSARGLLLIRGLPEHALLDRIIRGRAWIPLLGVLLAGIVAMQVETLKLGAGMGRWIERSSTLSSRNQALQASVAALMDDQRIERLAAKMGLVMPDPTTLSFLSAKPGGDPARAAANIHAPDPSTFASQSGLAAPVSSLTGGTSDPSQAADASSQATSTATSGPTTDSSQSSGSGGG